MKIKCNVKHNISVGFTYLQMCRAAALHTETSWKLKVKMITQSPTTRTSGKYRKNVRSIKVLPIMLVVN
jgi:hypothetical protein